MARERWSRAGPDARPVCPRCHTPSGSCSITMERSSLLGNAALPAQGARAAESRGGNVEEAHVPDAFDIAVIVPYLVVTAEVAQLSRDCYFFFFFLW